MCCLRHAEQPAKNRTSLAGLEQNLLFFDPPYIKLCPSFVHVTWNALSREEHEQLRRKEKYQR